MKRALLIAGGTVGGLGAVLSLTPPHLDVAASSVNSLASGGVTATATPDAPQTATPSTTPVSSPAPSSTTAASTPSAKTPTAVKKATGTSQKSTTQKATSQKASSTPATTASTPASQPSTATATQSSTPTPTKTTATPTPTKTTATPTTSASATGVSGSFTGATFDASQNGRLWGAVTVTVTLNNGEISNISANQSPSSRGYNAFNYLTPAVLTQKLSVKTVMSITPSSLVSQIRGYTGASYSCYAYWESLQSALSKAGF